MPAKPLIKTGPLSASDQARFRSKFIRLGQNDCWVWTGDTYPAGYARINIGGRNYKASRVAYFLHHGVYPTHGACHSCDNRLCVNPNHLFDGTQKQNMSDAAKKGRMKTYQVGHKPVTRLLNLTQVRQIKLALAGGAVQRRLAEQFGVPHQIINNIKLGKQYRDDT